MKVPVRVLILGGTGFVGSAVTARLRQNPALDLTLLSRRPPPGPDSRVRWIQGDLARLAPAALLDPPPDILIHLARFSGRQVWGRWWAGLRGCRANARLIAALRRLPAPPRIVVVSGSLMYGDRGEEWVEEDTPLRPTSFARQYILGERPFLQAQTEGRLEVSFVRPPWILGPGSWLATWYVEPLRREGCIPQYGPGQGWMSLLHRDDCAALIELVALQAPAGFNCNLVGPPPVRQREFAEILSRLTGRPVQEIPLAALRRRGDPALMEAFGSSIRLRSRHQDFLGRCPLRFGDPAAAVHDVLRRFEDIQQILAQPT